MTSCTQSWERAILPDLCLLAPGGPSLFQSIIVSLRVTIATFVHALVDSPCFHLPYCILFGYLYSAERAVHGDSPANSLPVSQSLCVKGQMYPPITLGLYMFPPYCGYVHFFPYLLPPFTPSSLPLSPPHCLTLLSPPLPSPSSSLPLCRLLVLSPHFFLLSLPLPALSSPPCPLLPS